MEKYFVYQIRKYILRRKVFENNWMMQNATPSTVGMLVLFHSAGYKVIKGDDKR